MPSIDFVTDRAARAPHFAPWIHGARPGTRGSDPPIQVQRFDDHTFVLRQSKSVDYEAPFMYLLMGNDRAFLLDTGATADGALFPLREVVDSLLAEWLASNPRDAYGLVVGHSHAHGDHHAGDHQFAGRAGTTVVGTAADAVCGFYGFADELSEPVSFELGGRVLEVLRTPGHDDTSVTVFDPWSGWLLTGDTVYPGRLYIRDAAAFVSTMDRLVAFASMRRVTAVMGCHIEMTTAPGVDYSQGTTWQPGEPALPMSPAQLEAVRAAADTAFVPGRHVFNDFIIDSLVGRAADPHIP